MIRHFRVIGLPPEEEWPTDVTLSRKNFPPLLPGPITDFVPEINEQGAQLLLVSSSHILHDKKFLWPMLLIPPVKPELRAGAPAAPFKGRLQMTNFPLALYLINTVQKQSGCHKHPSETVTVNCCGFVLTLFKWLNYSVSLFLQLGGCKHCI